MKHVLLTFCLCLAGCQSFETNETPQWKLKTRQLKPEEQKLVGIYEGTFSEEGETETFKIELMYNGHCELYEENKKLSDFPAKWRIKNGEVKLRGKLLFVWEDMMFFKVEDNGDLKLLAEFTDQRVNLPEEEQTIFKRIK